MRQIDENKAMHANRNSISNGPKAEEGGTDQRAKRGAIVGIKIRGRRLHALLLLHIYKLTESCEKVGRVEQLHVGE